MAKRTPPIYPAAQRQIQALGRRLRAARLRRGMSQAILAERVGVTIQTVGKLEAGNATTSVATLMRMLHVLGLGQDIDLLAADDEQGHAIQDSQLKRAPFKRTTS